jgi:hypothetical protein
MVVRFTIGQPGMLITGTERNSLTRAQVATHAGVVPNVVGDMPAGIVMDDAPTDNPPLMCDLASQGCWVEDTDLNMNVETDLVYSDGDGTYSTAEPAGAAGTKVWVLGVPFAPTRFRIAIWSYEKGA